MMRQACKLDAMGDGYERLAETETPGISHPSTLTVVHRKHSTSVIADHAWQKPALQSEASTGISDG